MQSLSVCSIIKIRSSKQTKNALYDHGTDSKTADAVSQFGFPKFDRLFGAGIYDPRQCDQHMLLISKKDFNLLADGVHHKTMHDSRCLLHTKSLLAIAAKTRGFV